MKNQIVRRFAAIALVLCLVFFCAACSKEETFKDFYKDYEYTDPYPLLDDMIQLHEFTGWILHSNMNELMVFTGEEGVKVYNTETETTVLALASDLYADISLVEAGGHTFVAVLTSGSQTAAGDVNGEIAATEPVEVAPEETIPGEEIETVVESQKPVVKLHDASGVEVLSAEGNFTGIPVNGVEDLLVVYDEIHRVGEDGKLTQISTNPFFGGIPSIKCKLGDYYCSHDYDSVTVYDESLNEIFFWEAPCSELDECLVVPLGENILVQIATLLPESDNDYDVFVDEEKYAIKSLILDPKKGSVKTVKLDYVVEYFSGADNEYAVVTMIEDRRIQDAPSALKKVRLNSKTGEIDAEVLTDLNGDVTPLVEDRFLYRTYGENVYLIDGDGKTIGKVNRLGSMYGVMRNESYIVCDGRLYNYNLEEVFNFEEKELRAYAMLGHSVIFENEEGAFLLYTKDGNLKELDKLAEDVYCGKQFFALQYEGRYMLPFNENGIYLDQELGSTWLNVISSNETEIYISVMSEVGMEYYKMYQAPTGK